MDFVAIGGNHYRKSTSITRLQPMTNEGTSTMTSDLGDAEQAGLPGIEGLPGRHRQTR